LLWLLLLLLQARSWLWLLPLLRRVLWACRWL
jgi:hypothetical protein